MKYPKYLKSEEAQQLCRDGMSMYQRGKRLDNEGVKALGELMITAGGGSVKQCAPLSYYMWVFIGLRPGAQERYIAKITAARAELNLD